MEITSHELKSVTVRITQRNAPALKKFRVAAKITQVTAAKTWGYSQSALSKIEDTNPASHLDGFIPLHALVRSLGLNAARALMKAGA